MSKIQTISVISFLSFCMIVGALVFCRGFLLNRQVIPKTSGPCPNARRTIGLNTINNTHQKSPPQGNQENNEQDNFTAASNWCNPEPPFPKLILILVDALRFDFVQRMEFLSEITKKDSSCASCTFKFIADPPTTTMQRLKALMTGTMPTFIDASANFNSYEVEEDSLIFQLDAIGKKIAFLGDDTWLSLFPKRYFKSKFVEAHPSFNAWDLDTVDRAVNKTIREIFSKENGKEWDVLISHLLGVDHCGHRYGPNHPEMVRKLGEADAIIKQVFNSMSSDTLLVIFGDHGMTSSGDHGGDSKDETESAVLFLSKQINKKFNQFNLPFQCQKHQRLSISQIDLVPTLAPLIGIPIPYSNIGQIIPEFLTNKTYSDAIAANVAQVHKYIQHFPSMFADTKSENNLVQQYNRIEDAFRDYQTIRNSQTRAKLHQLAEIYLKDVKALAVSTWTQFNIPMIYTGVGITIISVLSLFVYLASVETLMKRSSNSNYINNYTVLSWLWPSLSHWSVLCTFVYHSVSSTGLLGIIVSTLSGTLMFLFLIVFKLVKSCHFHSYHSFNFSKNIGEIVSLSLYVITCLVVFSNSFTINEGYVLGYTLVIVVLVRIIIVNREIVLKELGITATNQSTQVQNNAENQNLQSSNPEDNPRRMGAVRRLFRCSWFCFGTLIVIVRISSTFFRCREEQVDCNEDFLLHKQLSSLPEDWLVHKYLRYGIALLVLAVFVVSFRHWMMFRNCVFSRKPRAIIARFIPSLLVVLLGVFWALQGLPYISSSAAKIRLLMNYLPLVYQTVTVFSLIVIWFRPICCIGHLKHVPYFNSQRRKEFATTTTNYNEVIEPEIRNRNYSNANGKIQVIPHKQSNGIGSEILHNKMVNGGASTTTKSNIYSNGSASKNSRLTTDKKMERGLKKYCSCFSEDTYSSCLLTYGSLITLLLVQVTSTGIAPAVILQTYTLVSLVGIFRQQDNKSVDSWSTAVAWTLASQYFFYATGHQPIFSAIPWDSAFVGDGSGLANSGGSWSIWARAGLAVVGNLHVSQIISSFSLPLLVYWSGASNRRLESLMGEEERQATFLLYGKYLALHGLKLLTCMSCAAWHRRHLMVWKIFAPKFIFEAVSFIVTSSVCLLGMVFLTRINYCHQKIVHAIKSRSVV